MGMLSLDELVEEEQELLLQEVRMMIRTVGVLDNPLTFCWMLRDLAEEENEEWFYWCARLRLTDLQIAALKDNLDVIEEDVLKRASSRYLRQLEPDYDYC